MQRLRLSFRFIHSACLACLLGLIVFGAPVTARADGLPDNLEITGVGDVRYDAASGVLSIGDGSATLKTTGPVSLTSISAKGDLTIDGTGTLSVETSAKHQDAIRARNLEIKGGTVNATVRNPSGQDISAGSAINGTSSLSITGGKVTAIVENASTGAGSALVSGFGGIRIGTEGQAAGGPQVVARVTGIGFGNAVSASTVEMHSGSLDVDATTGTMYCYGLDATDLILDGGTLDVTAGGASRYAISAHRTEVSNRMGSGASGPTLIASAPKSAFSPKDDYPNSPDNTMKLVANADAEHQGCGFYPWLVQAGSSEANASVLSFAGALNFQSTDHAAVDQAGPWMKIQPAEIKAITFVSNTAMARRGADVDLSLSIVFQAGIQPTPRFGNGLVSLTELVGLGDDIFTGTGFDRHGFDPARDIDVNANVIRTKVANDATGRTVSATPQLSASAAAELAKVYPDALPVAPLSLAMDYVVTFDANGGSFNSGSAPVTSGLNLNGTIKADVPTPTRNAKVFAGWALSANAEPKDIIETNALKATAITAPTTYYAQWQDAKLALTATPRKVAADGTVNLSVATNLGVSADQLMWSFSKDSGDYQAFTPTSDSGDALTFTFTPTSSGMDGIGTYTIRVELKGKELSASTSVEVVGRTIEFVAANGSPSNQVLSTNGTIVEGFDTLVEPSYVDPTGQGVRKYFIGWYYRLAAESREWRHFTDGTDVTGISKVEAKWADVNIEMTKMGEDDESVRARTLASDGDVSTDDGERTAGFEVHVTVTPDDPGITLVKGFSSTAEPLTTEVTTGASVTPIEWGDFIYDINPEQTDPMARHPGRRDGSFSVMLLPDTTSANISLMGGSELIKSATVLYTEPSDDEGGTTTCLVTFDANGGAWSDGDTKKMTAVESGSTVEPPASPTRDGYEFLGWERQVDGKWQLADLTNLGVTAPLTLRAQWKAQPQPQPQPQPPATVAVYRLWNRYDGSHLLTSDENEYETLQEYGWKGEDVRFYQLAEGGVPIYRLYNPSNGDHLYTTDVNEYEELQHRGWRGEDVKLHGSVSSAHPVYRLWNACQTANGGLGSHLWTVDAHEYETLPTYEPKGAWRQEDVAWFAEALPDEPSESSPAS